MAANVDNVKNQKRLVLIIVNNLQIEGFTRLTNVDYIEREYKHLLTLKNVMVFNVDNVNKTTDIRNVNNNNTIKEIDNL